MLNAIFSLRSFLYLLYAVVLTSVLLYVRFPTEKFILFCEHRLQQFSEGAECSISKIDYSFPLTLEFVDVRIGSSDVKSDSLKIDQLQLSPTFIGMFSSWKIKGKMYSGVVQTVLTVPFDDDFFYFKEIRCEKIDIAAVVADMPTFERGISGALTFAGEYKGESTHPLAGFGKGNISLENGVLHLQSTVLSLGAMDFSLISVDWEYGEGMFHVLKGRMVGEQLNADFSGMLQPPFLASGGRLTIDGVIEPQEKFIKSKPKIKRLFQRLQQRSKKATVPFKVGGTLSKPTFRLSR